MKQAPHSAVLLGSQQGVPAIDSIVPAGGPEPRMWVLVKKDFTAEGRSHLHNICLQLPLQFPGLRI
jgi:hypothetical protein